MTDAYIDEKTIAVLAGLLKRPRAVVTISGPFCTGKTELARELAARSGAVVEDEWHDKRDTRRLGDALYQGRSAVIVCAQEHLVNIPADAHVVTRKRESVVVSFPRTA